MGLPLPCVTFQTISCLLHSIALLHDCGFVTPRSHSACVKWPKISLTAQRDLYFYHLLLLHLPHHSEIDLIVPYKSYFISFSCHQQELHMPDTQNAQYHVLMDMLKMSNSMNQSQLDDVCAQFAPASHEFYDADPPQSGLLYTDVCEPNHEAHDTSLPSFQQMDDNAFRELIISLNEIKT